MSSIQLTHVTLVGGQVPNASVEFGSKLSLVHGPSDTGKSFIVNAIDFALGASTLKEIPEREGYELVMLGVRFPGGGEYTLSRPIDGGRIQVYESDQRSRPEGLPDFTLATKHNPATEDNVSRFLLREVGLDDRRVKKNNRNETTSLSFRDLAHLAIVDETDMQSEVSPALSGSPIAKTREISVLKLLLQGEDDSELEAIPSTTDQTRARAAKAEVLEGLIAELDESLRETPERSELLDQLARLVSEIDRKSTATAEIAAERQKLLAQVSTAQNELQAIRERFGQAGELTARLDLLRVQYESDLSRLEMINEAGNLLGFFGSGICPFCGAEVEHQKNHEVAHGGDSFDQAVAAEVAKTRGLLADLLRTLEDLRSERGELRNQFASERDNFSGLQVQLADLDALLAPQQTEFRDLIGVRSHIERSLNLYEQLDAHRDRLTKIMAEAESETAAASAALSIRALDDFSLVMRNLLASWGFAESETVRYDRNEQDVIAGGQLRSAHGKGVRAILHAAFTVALAVFCIERGQPHPGFVILDSPLVTYRPPEPGESPIAADPELAPDLVSRFYESLEGLSGIQVIVLENTDPAGVLGDASADVMFTKSSAGRYGFFPLRTAPSTARLSLGDS